jgi:hypothetical protein
MVFVCLFASLSTYISFVCLSVLLFCLSHYVLFTCGLLDIRFFLLGVFFVCFFVSRLIVRYVLCICLYLCLCVYLSICFFVWLCVSLAVCSFVCLFFCLSACMSVCSFVFGRYEDAV